VRDAAPGDVIVVTGRGPEGEQYFGADAVHMDDRDAAARAMRQRVEQRL